MRGNGDGTFGNRSTFDVGIQPWTVIAGDFNGDGHNDLATSNEVGDSVTVLFHLP